MGWLDNLFGGGKETTEQTTKNEYVQLPDYAESTGARELMWDKLQGWGQDSGYGGVPQEWDKIWDLSKKKVNQYYWGDEMGGGGMVGKLKADAARKGQTNQPAYTANLSRLGKAESSQLSDIAVQQAIQEAQFAESGRTAWMNEMNALMGQKPNYQLGTQTTTQSQDSMGLGEMMGINSIMGMPGMPGNDTGGGGDWWSELLPLVGSTVGNMIMPGIGGAIGGGLGSAAQGMVGKATVDKDEDWNKEGMQESYYNRYGQSM